MVGAGDGEGGGVSASMPRRVAEVIGACEHLQTATTRRTISNGATQVVKQCANCGRAVSAPLPHSSVPVVEALPEFDVSLLERSQARQREEWESRRAENDSARAARHDEYSAYLLTPQWMAKRLKALERDGYMCQGCLNARATEVHHTTYSHLGAELLFQLISLCSNCHEWLHAEDRSGA